MGKFFDMDGGFFRFMSKVADFIILDVLVFLCSLPIITIGPSLTAMHYVALKEVRDEEGYLWRSYWKAFKDNFLQAFLIELIIIAAGVILFVDIRITYAWTYNEGSLVARLLFFVLLGFAAVIATSTMYVFPMLAKFDNTVIKIIKNSVMMCVKHLPQTIIMAIITYGLAYATFTYPLFILFSIGIVGYANSYILARIFDLYIPKKKQQTDEDFHVVDEKIEGNVETNIQANAETNTEASYTGLNENVDTDETDENEKHNSDI